MRPLDYCCSVRADEIDQPPEEEAPLLSWDSLRGIRSEQTIQEVADMLADAWNEDKRIAYLRGYTRQRQEPPAPPLLFFVHAWAYQFCVLNEWPTPECLEVVMPQLYTAVMNRA